MVRLPTVRPASLDTFSIRLYLTARLVQLIPIQQIMLAKTVWQTSSLQAPQEPMLTKLLVRSVLQASIHCQDRHARCVHQRTIVITVSDLIQTTAIIAKTASCSSLIQVHLHVLLAPSATASSAGKALACNVTKASLWLKVLAQLVLLVVRPVKMQHCVMCAKQDSSCQMALRLANSA